MNGEKYFEMIKSTLRMLGAMVMRDFNNEGVLVDIVMAFGVVLDNADKLRITN
jgi:hypothetical protein